MGRAPCCDKANVKKGPWSPEEDAKLKSYIQQHGTGGNWIALPPKIGLKRCGKSCRLRWLNYLRPNLKHGGFTEEEDNIICSLYVSIGSRWSVIAAQLPGRTDNDIKNYWNTKLKKKLLGKHRKEQARNRGNGNRASGDSSSLVPQNSTQQLYWPQVPVLPPFPYTNQGQSFNDQDAIRKLLLKLGGRFSDDYQPNLDGLNLQFTDGSQYPSKQQNYEQQVVHIGSSASVNSINNNLVQFPHTNDHRYKPSSSFKCPIRLDSFTSLVEGDAGLDMVQGQGSFTAAIGEMVSTNYPRRLSGSGMDFFYDEDIFTDKIIIGTPTCSESINWGENSTMIYPPLVASNYRQEMPQQCVLQELSYPREQ